MCEESWKNIIISVLKTVSEALQRVKLYYTKTIKDENTVISVSKQIHDKTNSKLNTKYYKYIMNDINFNPYPAGTESDNFLPPA